MSNIDNLVEQLGKLTVVEAGELSKKLEKVWNLNLSELTAAAQPVPKVEEENATVNVLLSGFDTGKKIGVIKAVRAIKDMGLLEAKNFVEDSAETPGELKSNIEKSEAEKIKSEIEAVGGKVEIK
jgi:large subunit ribosomal protein L7/L12